MLIGLMVASISKGSYKPETEVNTKNDLLLKWYSLFSNLEVEGWSAEELKNWLPYMLIDLEGFKKRGLDYSAELSKAITMHSNRLNDSIKHSRSFYKFFKRVSMALFWGISLLLIKNKEFESFLIAFLACLPVSFMLDGYVKLRDLKEMKKAQSQNTQDIIAQENRLWPHWNSGTPELINQ